jgi:glycosyltransferase involved in cell wall biosynthesis
MADKIAVLIPCYNEKLTIGQVIDDFQAKLPDSSIYVFDNNSTDRSAEVASARGVHVIKVPKQGKGHVVRAMFDLIAADYYIMVDADGTYPAEHVHDLLEPLKDGLADMVVGSRVASGHKKTFRPFHRFGNALVAKLIHWIWRTNLKDIMSGYRAYHSTVARSLPLLTVGFEIETEMTIQALDKGFTIIERPVPYGVRPQGSFSKLNTFRDGIKVVLLVFNIFKDYKPLTFFGGIGILLGLVSLMPGYEVIKDFLMDGSVEHIGAAVLFVGGFVLSVMFIHIGLILHSVSWKLKELYGVIRRSQTEKYSPHDRNK